MTTDRNIPAPAAKVDLAPQYDTNIYWLVLSTVGGDPRVVKRVPQIGPHEFCLKLDVMVPKVQRRVAQTIHIKLPEEFSHLTQIEVSVPDTGAKS